MTRDEALQEALKLANRNNAVWCFGQDAYDGSVWTCWGYSHRTPPEIHETSIRYVLPKGEVTKLS